MKKRDLSIITAIYILAYLTGWFVCRSYTDQMLKFFIFDCVATVVTFLFSVFLKNSSVYDAYWSLTPMVMSVWLFAEDSAWGYWQILFLVVFNIWSVRLTLNWVSVFTDFSYEDWRYRYFRTTTPKYFWQIVNFSGIHFFPTVVVFLGMLPLFSISKGHVGPFSLAGMMVILTGIAAEYFADKSMHAFLDSIRSMPSADRGVCRKGLWKYSRHPNYLGEILVWVGVYLSMIFYDAAHWYYVAGALAIAIMFNVISIPMMERRQRERRPEYVQYIQETPRLLPGFKWRT